jgi:hypothetical protein
VYARPCHTSNFPGNEQKEFTLSEISATANQSFFERLFPPTWRQIGVTAVVLLLLIILVITLEGLWPEFWGEGLWSQMLTAPTIIVYILIIGRVMVPFQLKAVDSLHQISALDDEAYDQLVQETQAKTSKGAAPALILGFIFGFLPSLPWTWDEGVSLVDLYLPLVVGLMFGLLVLVIQQSVSEGHLSNRLLQGPLNFDIFYTTPFIPIGLHGLVVALAFVGGSTIVVFFNAAGQIGFTWLDLILHGLLILVTIIIFFMTLRSTHRILREAKLAEQEKLRRHLADAYRRLEAMTLEEKQNILPFSTEVNLWRQYEDRLKEVPTWPYNAGILRTLFVSILLPVLVTLGQRLMAYILVELGIN